MATRDGSDEAYVVGLCNQMLGESALTQHRFDWLLGDPGAGGRRVRLPVDAYWPGHQLVVEYRELQHDQPTPHFDKPDRLTVSGVHRGEQRALYDVRRDTDIPAHGLRLVIIRPSDLDADSRGRLRRTEESDLAALQNILAHDSDEDRVTDTFRTWLLACGWTLVDPTDQRTDLEAVRGERRLICEAKGRTSEKGIDADIAYGQLLRRMTRQNPHTRYALVVPSSSAKATARVPAHIRQLLRIDVYEVTDDNRVCRLTD
ncbi:hypothetical protein [Streptomyces sp. NBC_01022]|uniref:hypothetical protein n=1 Tax=Streptomyces sp. NBC_01022 TaxID=2903723 RepID=UPI002DD87C1E|nr:hypothetical protein [Streptomyces sp. NBC_01022]WRZ79447.1 hypothetical protein OG316_03805 [Streptomyces sp. NBC_01022]WRZ86229.1 hypothetical protein OG316_41090 [Streptomyces sp. NBC_01022]